MGYKYSGDAQEVDVNIADETTSVEVEPADVSPEGEHAAEAAADPAEEDSSSAEDEDEQNHHMLLIIGILVIQRTIVNIVVLLFGLMRSWYLPGNTTRSKHYLDNVRTFNNMFSFTYIGGKIDRSMDTGSISPIFRLHGQNYHRIGSLLPSSGDEPMFAQLYIYDTRNEISNIINFARFNDNINTIHAEIVSDLKYMLDNCNVLVNFFRNARDRFMQGHSDVTMRLLGHRGFVPRMYNLPYVAEVAVVIPGDLDKTIGVRYIILQTRSGLLQRITELNPSYLTLQYPILFLYAEDGYREDILFAESQL
ncbi:hypothetical protein ACS0TY_016369 [Phlomoides rotata]